MKTKFMERLFSDPEFQAEVNEKIDEALDKGSAEIVNGDENLQFADAGEGEVVVEDKGNDEVTLIKGADTDDAVLESVDIEEKKESRRSFSSETQPDVAVPVVEGKDGDHVSDTVPDVEVTADAAITDPEKADSKEFSKRLDALEKKFGEVMQKIEQSVKNMEDQEEAVIETAIEGADDEMKAFSKLDNKSFAKILTNKANKAYSLIALTKKYSEDKELAEMASKECEECMDMADEAEDRGIDATEIKETLTKVSSEVTPEEVTEEEVAVEEKPVEEPAAPVDEAPVEEAPAEPVVEETQVEEVKEECDAAKTFSAVLNSKIGDCEVKPMANIAKDRLFSKGSEQTKSSNPFLTTKFE